MATITGLLEGLVTKSGVSKKTNKPYTMYSLRVGGENYGIGFNPAKVNSGQTVQFQAEKNERGYWEADPNSIKVIAEATPESAATAAASTANSNAIIERQTCLKVAGSVVAAQITAGVLTGQPNAAVAALVSDFMRILHPAPKAAPKPAPAPPAPQDDDFVDDDLPVF